MAVFATQPSDNAKMNNLEIDQPASTSSSQNQPESARINLIQPGST